jgi:hypothetical protein
MSNPVFWFAFIVALPFGMVAAVVVGLFATGAFFDAADHLDEVKARIEGMFRQPPATPRATAPDHYYRHYWV